MPIAKVQLPDGRIGRFEVAEGTTPDEIESFVSEQLGLSKPIQDPYKNSTSTLTKPNASFSSLSKEEKQALFDQLANGLNKTGVDPKEFFNNPDINKMPTDQQQQVGPSNVAQMAAPYYRAGLEGGGGIAGGIVGAPVGPLASVAGGTLGYGIGKKTADAIDEILKIQKPKSIIEHIIDTGRTLRTGATLEMGGQALFPIVLGGKLLFKKATQAFKPAENAAEMLVASTSNGQIYVQNAKQAKNLEKKIPGLKFTIGQQSNNPATIRMERAASQSSDIGVLATMEQRANNDAALYNYYKKTFSEKEGLPEVIEAMKAHKQGMNEIAETAQKTAARKIDNLPRQSPEETGKKIIETIETAKKPVKAIMEKLGSSIPDYPMNFKNYDESITEAMKNRMASPKEKSFIERLNTTLANLRKTEGETTHISQAMRRAINDAIGEADKNVPSAVPQLMKIKEALVLDIDDVTKLARTGKIVEYNGKIIDADKLAKELERNTLKIAKIQSKPPEPDIEAMITALTEKGVPAMQIYGETSKGFAKRITDDYTRVFKKDPIVQGRWKPAAEIVDFSSQRNTNPDIANLETRNAEIKKILSEVSPGQDVAAQLKAYNEYASNEYFKRFKEGPAGQVGRKGLKPEDIPNIFKTESGANGLIKAVGKEKAVSIARENLNYHVATKLTNSEGIVKPRELKTWIKNHMPMLKKYGIENDYNGLIKAQEVADIALKTAKDFENSAFAKMIDADPSTAVASVIKGNSSAKAAKNMLSIVKKNPAAKKGLQRAFAEHFFGEAQALVKNIRNGDKLSFAKMNRLMKKYNDSIQVLYKDQPRKVHALKNIQKAVNIMNRNVASPLGGGSPTNENLFATLKQIAGPVITHKSVAMNLAKFVFKGMSKKSAEETNRILVQAIFDPDYAATLVKLAKGDITSDIAIKQINNNVINLKDYVSNLKGAAAAGAALATKPIVEGVIRGPNN